MQITRKKVFNYTIESKILTETFDRLIDILEEQEIDDSINEDIYDKFIDIENILLKSNVKLEKEEIT